MGAKIVSLRQVLILRLPAYWAGTLPLELRRHRRQGGLDLSRTSETRTRDASVTPPPCDGPDGIRPRSSNKLDVNLPVLVRLGQGEGRPAPTLRYVIPVAVAPWVEMGGLKASCVPVLGSG